MRFVVVYDACVLYPAPLRDFLIRLATARLFAAKWTDRIHEEWIQNLLDKRPDLEGHLARTRQLMDQAVPDCLVEGYEPLVQGLSLPDPGDRHVLAAAIRAGAQSIVTFNLEDFPDSYLSPYGVEAVHPDTFVVQQLDLHEAKVVATAKHHRAALKKPPKSVDEYLDTLAAQGLVATADRLRPFEDVL